MAYRRVLIDTSILIDYFRKQDKTKSILFHLAKRNDTLLTSSICYFEYKIGSKDKDFDKRLFSSIDILPFDENQAIVASQIYKSLKAKNALIDFRDILIASCALYHNIKLSTLNHKHFIKIDGLQLVENI